MTILHLDGETASPVDLIAHGLDRYSREARLLMLGWAIDDSKTQLWEPHRQPKAPAELREALRDPSVICKAWNAQFERVAIFMHILKHPIPIRRWRCSMVQAYYVSLPGKLEAAGAAIGLPPDIVKMKEGKKLIQKFCVPRKRITKNKPFLWHDWNTDPAEWELFGQYCIRDVDSEREIAKRLAGFRMPDHEWENYFADQEINDLGMPVDFDLARNALALGEMEKRRLVRELQTTTGLSTMGVYNFMLWARERGYPFNNMRAATIDRAFEEHEDDMAAECQHALRLWQYAKKTGWSKFGTLLDQANVEDGVLRYLFQFYGAQRTGRYAGRGLQFHNLSRGNDDVKERIDDAVDAARFGDFDELYFGFEQPMMDVISTLIRPAFRAPVGKKFIVADLNAIENRVAGWLADCQTILDVFREKRDPYIAFAVYMYKQTYEELWHEYKVLKQKKKRTISKPAVLGAGYALGGGEQQLDKNGDLIKTGLWGYAESMGVDMTREESHMSVRVFRQAYPEVVALWAEYEQAAIRCIRTRETIRVGVVEFFIQAPCMGIRLPSGRALYYIRPRIEPVKFFRHDGKTFTEKKWAAHIASLDEEALTRIMGEVEVTTKEGISYEGVDQTTKQWVRLKTHGGKILENIDQAISCDLLKNGINNARAKGFEVRGHVHDEIITLVDEDSPLTLDDLIECLTRAPDWAIGLPLGAAGYEGQFFIKD